jgi:hypothetical protein
VEQDQVLLVDTRTGAVRPLGYPQAAIWDLIVRDSSWRGIVCKMGAIASLDAEAAERLVREAVDSWLEAGFLVAEEERG